MARAGSIPADIAAFLRNKSNGATIEEITAALNDVRRFEVRRPSVRSAIYQHLDHAGEGCFRRVSRGRYGLRK
jgi:hypothetical protein